MDIRERLNTSFNHTFEVVGCFRLRKINGGLDGCEDILGSMLSFPSKRGDVLVAALSISDVSGDFRGAYDLAFSIFDRRDRHRNVDQATVFAPANCFIMIGPLSTPNTPKDHGLLIKLFGRDENCDRPAHCFVSRIAEDALSALVPTLNGTVEVLRYDCVVAVVDHGSIPPESIVTFA